MVIALEQVHAHFMNEYICHRGIDAQEFGVLLGGVVKSEYRADLPATEPVRRRQVGRSITPVALAEPVQVVLHDRADVLANPGE